MVEVSIVCDKVRFEEKALYEKTQSKGIKSNIVDAKTITIGTDSKMNDFTTRRCNTAEKHKLLPRSLPVLLALNLLGSKS